MRATIGRQLVLIPVDAFRNVGDDDEQAIAEPHPSAVLAVCRAQLPRTVAEPDVEPGVQPRFRVGDEGFHLGEAVGEGGENLDRQRRHLAGWPVAQLADGDLIHHRACSFRHVTLLACRR